MIVNLNECFPVGISGRREPLPKQKEFMTLALDPTGPKFVAYYGGYGSGKSLILCITMISQGVLHGGEYVIARQFMPELRRTTMKLFLELVPKDLLLEHRVADAEIHIKAAGGKKAVFYFVGLDSPEKLDSLTLSGGAIDEASQVSEEAFLKLQGRLRSPVGLRKLLLVGNPKGHDWVYRYFLKQDMFQTVKEKSLYRIIVAPTTENIHLAPDYVQSMLSSYSKERIQRDIMGSFDSFEGQVYSEFNRALHVVRPFRIPDEWTRVIGADHGYTNPTCFLWGAMDYDGAIYIYREFYEREWLIEEIVKGKNVQGAHQKGVLELTSKGEMKELEGAFIDPSTRSVRSQTGVSDWDTYLEHFPNSFPLYPAKNDVSSGIDKVKSYLKANDKTGKPRLYIFETCVNLLDELSEYRWAELGPNQEGRVNQKEAPRKYNDHAADALRYLVASRPDAPEMKKQPNKAPYATSEWVLRQELKRLKKPKLADPFGF